MDAAPDAHDIFAPPPALQQTIWPRVWPGLDGLLVSRSQAAANPAVVSVTVSSRTISQPDGRCANNHRPPQRAARGCVNPWRLLSALAASAMVRGGTRLRTDCASPDEGRHWVEVQAAELGSTETTGRFDA